MRVRIGGGRAAAGLLLVLLLAGLAACSSASGSGAAATTTQPDAAAIWREVIQCLRDNGMPNLPDPSIDSDGEPHFPGGDPGDPPVRARRACEPIYNRLPAQERGEETRPPADVPALLRFATEVLVLTSSSDDEHLLAAVRAGALAYLPKTAGVDQVVGSVRAAARGESVLEPRIAARLLREVREVAVRRRPLDQLSPREREVLAALARGRSNRQIARALQIRRRP